MRSTIIAAAFALGALAVPHQKRDVVTNTEVDVVYVTDIETVTAGQGSAPTQQAAPKAHYGHGNGHGHGGFHWAPPKQQSSPEASPTSTQPVPQQSQPASQWSSTAESTSQPSQTSSPSSGSGPSAPASDSYQDIATYHHNLHRANHSAPDIAWDDDLQKSAAAIAATCVYAHNTQMMGGGYGQNIAAGVSSDNISAVITDLFYNGEVGWYDGLYGQANPSMTNFEHWGHFSQIVWKGTTHFACATQDCTGGLANTGGDVSPYFTVCNYKSPGNMGGAYGQNVGQPLGHATAQWNAGM